MTTAEDTQTTTIESPCLVPGLDATLMVTVALAEAEALRLQAAFAMDQAAIAVANASFCDMSPLGQRTLH